MGEEVRVGRDINLVHVNVGPGGQIHRFLKIFLKHKLTPSNATAETMCIYYIIHIPKESRSVSQNARNLIKGF